MKFKLFCVALASVLLSCLAAEIGVRAFHPAPVVFDFSLSDKESSFERSDNPILGYTLKANVRNEEANCHNNFPYTNAFGFRDRERELARQPGVKRVLLLGDSVVAGHGLCDLNDTMSSRLEKSLEGKAEVLNFGVGGYCTRGEIELLKEKGLAFAPDLVVVLFVNNDYVNSNGHIINALNNPPPSWARLLFFNSDLARWISLRFNLYGLRSNLDASSHLEANRNAIGDNNIQDGMALLSKLAEEHNFKVLVALWPYFLDSSIQEPTPSSKDKGDSPLLIEQLAAQYGFKSFRLSRGFERDFAKRGAKHVSRRAIASPRWFYTIGDGTHHSQLGAKVAAKLLTKPILVSLDSKL